MRAGAAPAALLATLLASLLLAGCASPVAAARPGRPSRPLPVPLAPSEYHEEPAVAGVVHVVRRGETVYRIARAYGVSPDDLLEANGIVDPRQVAVGTELFVPGASRVVEVDEVAGARPPADKAAPERRPGETSPGAAAAGRDPPAEAATPRNPRLAWPLKGVLYGRYGVRAGQRHDGIDLSAPEGTTIGAAAAGSVIFAGEQNGYGSIVIVRHDGGLVTLYAHCSKVLVDEGASVKAGQPIARVGQTGRSTGPHLHFEVREGTRPRNPLLFLP